MTEIDKSKIKVGDEVRFSYWGLLSDGFLTVTERVPDWGTPYLAVATGPDNLFAIRDAAFKVLEHKPNFKELENELEKARIVRNTAQASFNAAQERYAAAERALNEAKKPKIGDSVLIIHRDHTYYDRVGKVVERPSHALSYTTSDQVWVQVNDNSPLYYPVAALKVVS